MDDTDLTDEHRFFSSLIAHNLLITFGEGCAVQNSLIRHSKFTHRLFWFLQNHRLLLQKCVLCTFSEEMVHTISRNNPHWSVGVTGIVSAYFKCDNLLLKGKLKSKHHCKYTHHLRLK